MSTLLREDGTIQSALAGLGLAPPPCEQGLPADIEALIAAVKRHPWTTLVVLRGEPTLLRRIGEAEKLLRDLKKALSK